MQGAFVTVVVVVVVGAALIGLLTMIFGQSPWEEYGRRGLLMERDAPAPKRSTSVGSDAERDLEIQQMLEARNARRARRGEQPLDLDAELDRLTSGPPTVDAALRQEIREMVIARNHRRVRKGQPPLDVESEVARQIAEL